MIRRNLVKLAFVAIAAAQLLTVTPAPVGAEHSSTYISPTYGYSLTFDQNAWRVMAATSKNGYDVLELSNGVSKIVLEGAANEAANAGSCLQDEFARLAARADIADLSLIDQFGVGLAGWDGVAVQYAYTRGMDGGRPDALAGQKWCALIAPGASLVVTQIAPEDLLLAGQLGAGTMLLAGLQSPSEATGL
jgi:hypothetical protein